MLTSNDLLGLYAMLDCLLTATDQRAIPIVPLVTDRLQSWQTAQSTRVQNCLKSSLFQAKSAEVCLLRDEQGHLQQVLLGLAHSDDFWAYGQLPLSVPAGVYEIHSEFSAQQMHLASLAWALGSYQFDRYKQDLPELDAKLLLPKQCDASLIDHTANAIYLVRDLINMPPEEMGPSEFAEVVQLVAKNCQAKFKQIVGEELLRKNFPAIHAVGRACDDPPRLLELTWGDKHAPKVVLVGKGVCFDTGGLNVKLAKSMLSQKKDLGGAAHALALAQLIIQTQLPVQLRVLLPVVENSIGDRAYRPSDVIRTRSGITVEVTNTDAEGRMILSDALAEASSDEPELIVDFATLTGAARVALGTDVAAMFTDHNEISSGIFQAALHEHDPLWRMPLYRPYLQMLDSQVADIANASYAGYGGAILAGLFLQKFVGKVPWVHFDIMGANIVSTPGRPEGGEAMGLRAVYRYLHDKYALL